MTGWKLPCAMVQGRSEHHVAYYFEHDMPPFVKDGFADQESAEKAKTALEMTILDLTSACMAGLLHSSQ
jgi:hypothetical protein